jgi:Trk K+ transport system NAD-binding subunit
MSNTEERSYGQGAQGEPAAPKPTKVSLGKRIRYSIDNSFGKSGVFALYMLLAIAVASALIVIIKYVLYAVPGLLPEGTPPLAAPTVDTFWTSFTDVIGRGGGASWADRIVGVLVWIVIIVSGGTVTGFIVGIINAALTEIKKGRSPIIARNHTLILGWSNLIFPILNELQEAGLNQRRKPTVVIFANKTREWMEQQIKNNAGSLKRLDVVTRMGDLNSLSELKRTNLGTSKSVIILDEASKSDAGSVNTVFAVKALSTNPNQKLIVEIDDENVANSLAVATKGQVIPIRSHDIIARVTAQASRQPGLAAVILDLLDFGGDEIYFQAVPALAGKTYKEALVSFNEASIIGLAHADGTVALNPKGTTKLKVNDKVIAVAADDDKVVYTGPTDLVVKLKPVASKIPARKPEHMLVIGWSSMGRTILKELAPFMVKGSTVHIIAKKEFVRRSETEDLNFGLLKTTFDYTSGSIDDMTTAAGAKHYDQILVLGYRKGVTVADADALTMLSMLQLNQLFEQDGNGVEPTRLVAEIIDSSKAEIARVAAVDDLVVSDKLAALLMTQIAENVALAPVFADLFDAAGASINLKPIQYFAAVGKEVSFGELVAAAAAHGDSAIGIRVAANASQDGSTGVQLNPSKHETFKPAAGDGLVVVGNLE